MREIVCVQFGQCGNRIGERFWEEICVEHCMNFCGKFIGDSVIPYQRLNVYFQCAQSGRFVPRCVAVDLDPANINQYKNSCVGKLFNPEYLISGHNGAGNNFAKGYFTDGCELLEPILESCRLQAEVCDCMHGFQISHSVGGGCGSGLGALTIRNLRTEYEDRMITAYTVVPSCKVSRVVTEPYNSVLALAELSCNADEIIVFDNEALFEITYEQLKIPVPNHMHLNHIIAMTMAGVTCPFRYPGQLNSDYRKIMTNMCPFPNLKFFIPGYAPYTSCCNNPSYEKLSVRAIAKQLFERNSHLADLDGSAEKILTCATIFRGLVSSREVEDAMVEVQACNKDLFVKFIPSNIKSAICDIPPRGLDMSATLLSNSSAAADIFRRLIHQFDCLFKKRAFIHWYTTEGMEEEEFKQARDILTKIADEYCEAINFDCGETYSDDECDGCALDNSYC